MLFPGKSPDVGRSASTSMVNGFSLILTCGELEWEPGACEGGDLEGCIGVCICVNSTRQGVRAGALRAVVLVPG